jgi:hypothetical protein
LFHSLPAFVTPFVTSPIWVIFPFTLYIFVIWF